SAIALKERDTAVAFNAPRLESDVIREQFQEVFRVVRSLSAKDAFARRAPERNLEIFQELAPSPDCQGSKTLGAASQLANEGVLARKRAREVVDQGTEESLARFSFHPFGDSPQRIRFGQRPADVWS